MPLPDLETLCVELTVTPQRLSVTLPGGATLVPELPNLGISDPLQLSQQLLAQANAALAPLDPYSTASIWHSPCSTPGSCCSHRGDHGRAVG